MPTPFQAFRRSLDISKYVLLSQRHNTQDDGAEHKDIIQMTPYIAAIVFFYNLIYLFSCHNYTEYFYISLLFYIVKRCRCLGKPFLSAPPLAYLMRLKSYYTFLCIIETLLL